MRRVLMITSDYTGHGHRSISDAISEQLSQFDDCLIKVIDGFSLIGRIGVSASKIYGPLTRSTPWLFQMSYSASDIRPDATEKLMSALIAGKFLRVLREFNPDVIVSVHCMFVSSVLNCLEWWHITDIPFIAVQTDPIDIHAYWFDHRVKLSICLTEEAYAASLHSDVEKEKLALIGFPTRARFCEAVRNADIKEYDSGVPFHCLMMSGGDGGSAMVQYAKTILPETNCTMEFICGRDKKCKARLEKALLPEYRDRVKIFGFIDDIEQHMLKADLLIARGSPNTLMEAVVMNLPIMIIGNLPGQEADNPDFMVAHNLAITCYSPKIAPSLLHVLRENDGERWKSIRASQKAYRNLDNAKNIAQRIYDMAEPLNRDFPARKSHHSV